MKVQRILKDGSFEHGVSTGSGSDRVTVLSISIIAIGYPVATALGTDLITCQAAAWDKDSQKVSECRTSVHSKRSVAQLIAEIPRKLPKSN